MKLTKSEHEVMQTLWVAGRPLARHEIIEQCVEPSWSPSTIHILLNGLLQKGAIHEAGFVKRNKTYGRLYEPLISGEQYYAETLFSKQNSNVLPIYFSALLRSETIDRDTVAEMERMLAARKKELGLDA